MFIWVALIGECQISKDIVENFNSVFESGISAVAIDNYHKREPQGNLTRTLSLHGPVTWKVMQRNAWKDIANKTIQQLYKVATPCIDDHPFEEE